LDECEKFLCDPSQHIFNPKEDIIPNHSLTEEFGLYCEKEYMRIMYKVTRFGDLGVPAGPGHYWIRDLWDGGGLQGQDGGRQDLLEVLCHRLIILLARQQTILDDFRLYTCLDKLLTNIDPTANSAV
jgi:hypothetical protein